MVVGLTGFEDPCGSLFLVIQRLTNSLLTVLQFVPQNPAQKGAKIAGEPIQNMCSQGILVVPLLVSILMS